MMGIIGDNQMVDVDLRKPIFCFFIEMSDDGVGVEADYHEKVRYFFNSFGVVVQDFASIRRDGELVNEIVVVD